VTKVLYVEDNDDNVFMLKMRLELLGDLRSHRFALRNTHGRQHRDVAARICLGGATLRYIQEARP
jgi:hypothetical protein